MRPQNPGRRTRPDCTGTQPTADCVYVHNNPINHVDPLGLAGDGHHYIPQSQWEGFSDEIKEAWDAESARVPTPKGPESHNYTGHGEYNDRVQAQLKGYMKERGLTKRSFRKEHAEEFLERIRNSSDEYIGGFNRVVGKGRSATDRWSKTAGAKIKAADAEAIMLARRAGGAARKGEGRVLKTVLTRSGKFMKVVAIGTFVYYVYEGGVTYAADRTARDAVFGDEIQGAMQAVERASVEKDRRARAGFHRKLSEASGLSVEEVDDWLGRLGPASPEDAADE